MKSPSKPNQIKSKKRVKDFGEVYTQEREVKVILDLVKEESYQDAIKIIEIFRKNDKRWGECKLWLN